MIEKGSREGIEIERKETKGNGVVNNLKRRIKNRHLPLLVVQLPQGTTFLLSSQLDSAVKCCSSIVDYARLAAAVKYYSPVERLGKGSGPKRLVKY